MEILHHQYELEKELRQRTVRELESHESQLGELYGARNDIVLRLDRLEQAECRRKWCYRAILTAVIGLVIKAVVPLIFKAINAGMNP